MKKNSLTLIGTANRVGDAAHGVPCYAVTIGNATVHIEVVSDTEWRGNLAKSFGDRVAREAWRLSFPPRFLVAGNTESESSACKRNNWCVRQVGHGGDCSTTHAAL